MNQYSYKKNRVPRVANRTDFVRIVRKLHGVSGNRNKVNPDSILSGKLENRIKYKNYVYFIILIEFCLGTSCNRPQFYIQTVSMSIFKEIRKAKLGDKIDFRCEFSNNLWGGAHRAPPQTPPPAQSWVPASPSITPPPLQHACAST